MLLYYKYLFVNIEKKKYQQNVVVNCMYIYVFLI